MLIFLSFWFSISFFIHSYKIQDNFINKNQNKINKKSKKYDLSNFSLASISTIFNEYNKSEEENVSTNSSCISNKVEEGSDNISLVSETQDTFTQSFETFSYSKNIPSIKYKQEESQQDLESEQDTTFSFSEDFSKSISKNLTNITDMTNKRKTHNKRVYKKFNQDKKDHKKTKNKEKEKYDQCKKCEKELNIHSRKKRNNYKSYDHSSDESNYYSDSESCSNHKHRNKVYTIPNYSRNQECIKDKKEVNKSFPVRRSSSCSNLDDKVPILIERIQKLPNTKKSWDSSSCSSSSQNDSNHHKKNEKIKIQVKRISEKDSYGFDKEEENSNESNSIMGGVWKEINNTIKGLEQEIENGQQEQDDEEEEQQNTNINDDYTNDQEEKYTDREESENDSSSEQKEEEKQKQKRNNIYRSNSNSDQEYYSSSDEDYSRKDDTRSYISHSSSSCSSYPNRSFIIRKREPIETKYDFSDKELDTESDTESEDEIINENKYKQNYHKNNNQDNKNDDSLSNLSSYEKHLLEKIANSTNKQRKQLIKNLTPKLKKLLF